MMTLLFRSCLLFSLVSLLACGTDLEDFTPDQELTLGSKSITLWPEQVEESSGLAQQGELSWTLNDSGDKAAIYALDSKGALLKKVFIRDGHNFDFEEMAQDKDYLYVADIGDNWGGREKLTIYKLAWVNIAECENEGLVDAEKITVRLASREKYNHKNSHNYDFEGMAVRNKELWLFSKNRLDGRSELYRFAKQPGSYTIAPSASYAVNGLITSVDIHPETGRVALLGYQIHSMRFSSFIWLAPSNDEGLDWSKARSVGLEPSGQWEALMWSKQADQLVLSREESRQGKVAIANLDLP